MTQQLTIRESFEQFDATGFIFCDRGNGSAYGESGQFVRIDNDDLEAYGEIAMHRLEEPMTSEDGLEVEWLSDWIADKNGYEYRVGA